MPLALRGAGLIALGLFGLFASVVLLSTFGGISFSASLPFDGITQSKIARQPYVLAVVDPSRARTFCADARIAAMAHRGVTLEPLDGNAITAATLARGCGEDGIELSHPVVMKTLALNRRALTLQGLQMQVQAAEGDTEGALATVRRMIVTQPHFSEQVVPAIGGALGRTDDLSYVARLMRGHPEWMRAMIRYAAANLEPRRAVQVRQEFVGESKRELAPADRDAVRLLASRNALPHAWAFYQLSGASKNRGEGDLLAAHGQMGPFGWTIPQGDQMRARLAPREGLLIQAHLRLAASGTLAFQTFVIKEGRFQLTIDAEVPEAVELETSIRCADETAQGQWIDIANNALLDISESLPDCRFAAIRLQLENASRDRRNRVLVRSVNLIES